MNIRTTLSTFPLVIFVLVLGCGKQTPPPAPPPPEVRVVTLQAAPISNTIEMPGRLEAVRTAEVRGRVDGIVQRRLYQEGTDVREGQPLFAIDPRELRARLGAAEAALARAQAMAANAARDVERYQGLLPKQAISQQEYDSAVARQRTAEADVAQARSSVDAARLSLGYTTVTAPIAGRAGRAMVTEGALVSAGAATLLTLIEQVDPIYANFSQSSSQLLEIRKEVASGEVELQPNGRIAAHLILEDGTEYPHTGHINFVDLRIDRATGTAANRAVFPNPDRTLLPGQFVRVRIEAGRRTGGLLLPQRAVTVTPQGAVVMVVGADDVVEARPVTLGALQGSSWVVLSGVSSGERVIVDGLQKARPGQKVQAVAAAS